ncbi:L-alanine exporter AlaE [Sulfitobacter sp. D35]|uniref:L-alanine exporter AlaE n=1 Tax=Sulfitobacter sp. D35 TaxID=3083252 RepID=UPI00296EDE47|nr:L-alanine exporter AlaE [Sulfitobacter sp. D35]MDW4498041.1 L-alanine exporter AlaE [Sulfitobacter sp. D35]
MRRTLVDTFATIAFFTTVAAVTELFVAGMAPAEVLKTRATMIPLMVLTGRPYGLWRDWFFRTTKPTVSWSKTLIDGSAFLSFQLPVYGLVLFIVGADGGEILVLLASTAILMFVVSRPFGIFLEFTRRLFGVD